MTATKENLQYRRLSAGEDPAELWNCFDIYHPCPDPEEYDGTLFPAYIHIHGGGGWLGSNKEPQYPELGGRLAAANIVAAFPNYRLAEPPPWEPGTEIEHLRAAVADIRQVIECAFHHAQAARIDPNRIFVGGSSYGAAATLAAVYGDPWDPAGLLTPNWRRRLAGVCAMWGALFSEDGVLTEPVDGINWFLAWTVCWDPKILWIHGTDDTNEMTPPAAAVEAQRQAAAAGLPFELNWLQGAGHAPWGRMSEIEALLKGWIL